MKKLMTTVITILFISMFSYAQDLDEVLEGYYEAIGQDKLNKVESMIVKGKSVMGPQEYPFVVYIKAPNKMRVEVNIQNQKYIQVFDGESGWQIVPWSGSTDPQDIDPTQLKALGIMADVKGPLYNYKEEGYTATLLEDDEYEGTPVYKIEIDVEEGDKLVYVLDQETFIPLAQIYHTTMQGQEIKQEVVYGNYQMIDGIALSFSDQTKVNGQVQRSTETESVEFNQEIDDALYIKPEPEVKETKEAPEEK